MLIIREDQEAPDNLVHQVKTGDDYHRPGVQPGEFIVSEKMYKELKKALSLPKLAA